MLQVRVTGIEEEEELNVYKLNGVQSYNKATKNSSGSWTPNAGHTISINQN
jgi:hypothetical protein